MPVVSNGLQFYWNAKDGVKSGNTLANIAPGGIVRNLSFFGATYNSGGGFLLLDGIDDYLTISASGTAMQSAGSFTYEYIFYALDNQNDGGYHELISGGTYFDIDFSIPGFYDEIYAGNNHVVVESTDSSVIGPKQFHYVLRYNSSTGVVTTFVNGVQRTQRTLATGLQWVRSGNSTVNINNSNGSDSFSIRFNALRFYNRALTNEEVATNTANGVEIGFDTPMVKIAEWKVPGVIIPVYNINNHPAQSLRVQTANGLGFIPLVPTTDPAASKIRVRKGSTTLAMRL